MLARSVLLGCGNFSKLVVIALGAGLFCSIGVIGINVVFSLIGIGSMITNEF